MMSLSIRSIFIRACCQGPVLGAVGARPCCGVNVRAHPSVGVMFGTLVGTTFRTKARVLSFEGNLGDRDAPLNRSSYKFETNLNKFYQCTQTNE